jgi:UDP-galactopyranose mutase
MYDYLVVGAGFFGATFARLMTDAGRRCLVIDVRPHVAGNAYTERVDDIDVHMYGAHIFHTDNQNIWNFVNRFGEFNNYVNSPKALASGKLYSLPFNMNTFYQLWGCVTPVEAQQIIDSQRLKLDRPADNLEEQALTLVGPDIYNLLIKEYTRKQWQREPKDLPAFIIKRLPMRWTYNDNYFGDRYQGIPVNGYTELVKNMLDGIDVELGVDYFKDRAHLDSLANRIVFTGRIDEFFDYSHGELEYRTLDFEHETLDTDNYQGNAVINYCDADVPWTRIVEHRHFNKSQSKRTVITRELPAVWSKDKVPYYPINDDVNQERFEKYQALAESTSVIFGGRLAEYRYYDMHQVIGSAMKTAKDLLK